MCLEKILETYEDWLQADSIFGYIVRTIVGLLIKGLYWLSSTMEKAVDTVLTLTSFYKESSEVSTAYQAMLYLGFALLTIFLIFLGYKFWLGKNIEIKSVFINTIIIGASIILLPTVFDFGLQVAKQFNQDTKKLGQVSPNQSDSLSFNVISDNIVDLVYADQQDFPDINKLKKNRITKEQWDKGQIDLLENAEPEGLLSALFSDKDKLKHEDVFKHQLTVGTDGKLKAVELNQKSFPFWDTWYFRYGMKSFTIISTLLVLSIAYGLSAMKLVRVAIELVVQKLIFPIVAFSDVETGQRLKGMWQDIAQSFLTIAMIGLNLRIFVLFQTWLATKNINPVLYFFVTLIAALVAIDGADTFKKHFGTDVGLKDEWRSFLGLYAGGKAISAMGSMAKDTVGTVANVAGKATDAVRPHVENIKSGKTLNDMKDGVQNVGEFVGQQVGYMEEGKFFSHTAQSAKDGIKQFKDTAVSNVTKPFTTTASAVKDLADSAKEGYQSGNEQAIYDTIQERSQQSEQNQVVEPDNEPLNSVPYPTRTISSVDSSHQQTGTLPTSPYETIQRDFDNVSKPSAYDANATPSIEQYSEEQPNVSVDTGNDTHRISNEQNDEMNRGPVQQPNEDRAVEASTHQVQADRNSPKIDQPNPKLSESTSRENSGVQSVEPSGTTQLQTNVPNVPEEDTMNVNANKPEHIQQKEKKQFNTEGLIVDKDVTLSSLRNNKENVRLTNEQQPEMTEQSKTSVNNPDANVQMPSLSTEVPEPTSQTTRTSNKEMKHGVSEHQVNQEVQNVQDQKVTVQQNQTSVEGTTEKNIEKQNIATQLEQPEFSTQSLNSNHLETRKTQSYERVQENQVSEHEHLVDKEVNHTHKQTEKIQNEISNLTQNSNTQSVTHTTNKTIIDNPNHSTTNQ